jgi:hypothetical protein
MALYNAIQGNLGLGKAIEYFTSQNIPVAIPLNDTQKYDIVADFDGKLQKISIKTSRYQPRENVFEVMLKNTGGSSGNNKIRLFDNDNCDYIFIYTANEDLYLIPSKEITATNSICVGNKYVEYKVFIKTLSDFDEEVR